MTLTADTSYPVRAAATPIAPATARMRDVRLDFFRGLAMFIILISHTPGNWLTLWIPARFGFSDATEIFVFCSGMASAIAFGGVFAARGWLMGTARVVFRLWQVYWAHIGLFMAIATLMALLDASGSFPNRSYVGQLNLVPFFNNPAAQLPGLLTLTYVPNYFDILPMYLVILAMMPLVMAAHRAGLWGVAALVVALWLLAAFDVASLPAEPWTDRRWFFNPFGWQLIFFTGFAFMRGWIPAPPVTPLLIGMALTVVLLSVPLSYYRLLRSYEVLRELRATIAPLADKTDFGMLRYVHFLSLAYLAWAAAGAGGDRLRPTGNGTLSRVWGVILAAILKVGQQSLAIFVTSMGLAQILGVALDVTDHDRGLALLFNVIGMAILVAVAYGIGWFKSQPWKRHA